MLFIHWAAAGLKYALPAAEEREAMQAIRKVVGDPLGEELYELWAEYEDLKTVEAIYCKDIDKFEMVVQAWIEHTTLQQPNSQTSF